MGSLHPVAVSGPIVTARLRLECLTAADLRWLAAGRPARVVDRLRYHVPDPGLLPSAGFALRRLKLIEADAQQLPWIFRSIILTATDTLIGNINFHHRPPDPFLLPYAAHAAELGYSIAPAYRRHGYATEAMEGMMDWAGRVAGVRSFFLSISLDNPASLRLALKLGFRQVGEQIDEEDGLEWVFRRDSTFVRGSPLTSCA